MKGKVELNPDSREWTSVDFRIQTITGKSSIQILNLYSYPGHPQVITFTRRTSRPKESSKSPISIANTLTE